MTYTAAMTSITDLRRALLDKDVQVVAALAGVSTKTVYRIRSGEHYPNLKTAERLLLACDGKPSPRKRKAKPQRQEG